MSSGRALDAPLTTLSGVGPARAEAFARVELESLRDLLLLLPRGLEDTGESCDVVSARSRVGERVVVSASIARRRFSRFGRRSLLRLELEDDSGGGLEVVFHNQPWQRHGFEKGDQVTFSGCVTHTRRGPALVTPRFAEGRDAIAAGQLTSIYPTPKGVGQVLLRSLIARAFETARGELVERLAEEERARLGLPELERAVEALHRPPDLEGFARARRRVLLERLLPLEAAVLARGRAGKKRGPARRVLPEGGRRARFEAALGFVLTGGQRRVLDELDADLAAGAPMRRLLQGDVGAGKTVLGLYAAWAVAHSGGQVAFMAPTELLAEQHASGLAPLTERLGLRCAVLTGSTRAAERKRITAALRGAELDLVFGTHVLFSRDVGFQDLALAVIDEQQRFGVTQRRRLQEKGEAAHLFLMTATPIPRTLAHTIYGDLDVSVLREKPPGRGRVRTRWLRPKDRKRLPAFLAERLEAGEQLYWVSPLVGEDGERGATRALERLGRTPLARFGLELVHGRLASEERARRLERFRRGESRVLVATTVIEVGVDVPAATVLVVQDAERLGLAQLHQLRGRVGRGAAESYCLLHGKPTARERFELLESTSDGFEIAEADLRQRGMGELTGTRQAGELGGLLSELEGDLDLLAAARELLAARPDLAEAYGRAEAPVVTP